MISTLAGGAAMTSGDVVVSAATAGGASVGTSVGTGVSTGPAASAVGSASACWVGTSVGACSGDRVGGTTFTTRGVGVGPVRAGSGDGDGVTAGRVGTDVGGGLSGGSACSLSVMRSACSSPVFGVGVND